MSGMRTVVVDKIASVTQACGLLHEVRIAPEIPCEEGVALVVEVLNNKSTYNTLELTSGRMAKISRGDVVVGALGHRKALFGYSGHIPEALQCVQDLSAGEQRQVHSASSTTSRSEFGSASPVSCSKYSSMASRTLASADSRLRPCDQQAGSAGQWTTK